MSTLQQLREGVSQAWDSLVDGWQKLYRHAVGAITRFNPTVRKGEAVGADRELAIRSIGWGVLAAEVFDDDDRVVVRLEAPGLERDDLDVQVVDDVLVVRGQKGYESESSRGRYHIIECAYGSFERAIPLPASVDPNAAKASYRRGVLRVELPKSAASRARTINVGAG